MKKRRLLFLVICLVGIGLILYPTISSQWNKARSSRAVSNYVEYVDALKEEEKQSMLEAARAYNEALASGKQTPDAEEELDIYEDKLNTDQNGVIGYVDIPRLGITLPIYHGTGESALSAGVGHLSWTSLPVGGENTHCVLAGHRGLPSAELFTNLDKMEEGDNFEIVVLGETLTYEVDQIKVVLPENYEDLYIEAGMDYCTLLTCTPYGLNTHRLLVRGHRVANIVEESPEIEEVEAEKPESWLFRIIMLIIALVILILLILNFILFVRRRSGKKH